MAQQKILIIEDEDTLRQSLRRVLQKDGYEVDAVDSSEEGLESIRGHPYDLVLTDIILPGETGLQFLKKCREQNPGIKVVVMTAYATIETAVDAIRAGASEYLVKPINHEELKELIRKTLKES